MPVSEYIAWNSIQDEPREKWQIRLMCRMSDAFCRGWAEGEKKAGGRPPTKWKEFDGFYNRVEAVKLWERRQWQSMRGLSR